MAEGAWNHTANLLAMLYNAHRHPDCPRLGLKDFPLLASERHEPSERIQSADISVLKQVFVREERGD